MHRLFIRYMNINWRKIIKTEMQFAGWFIVASLVQTYFTCRRCGFGREFFLVSFFTFIMWELLWRGNNGLTHYVNEKISWFRFPIKRLIVGLISTMAYTLITVVAALYFFQYAFNFSFGDSFQWTINFSVVLTILFSLILHSREFLIRGRDATLNAEKLEKENIRAKYESLKSQVSPHFLFNSLNALTGLVYEDQDKAAKFIKQLSEVYRYVLDTRDKELVQLEDEKRFLESYLFLQKIRFGDKLHLNIRLDNVDSLIAPLVLQMLVENSIKHNEVSDEHPLYISIFVDGDFIVVENNLKKKSLTLEDSAGVGLENITKRYQFLTDKIVSISSDDKFVVKLPIIPNELYS